MSGDYANSVANLFKVDRKIIKQLLRAGALPQWNGVRDFSLPFRSDTRCIEILEEYRGLFDTKLEDFIVELRSPESAIDFAYFRPYRREASSYYAVDSRGNPWREHRIPVKVDDLLSAKYPELVTLERKAIVFGAMFASDVTPAKHAFLQRLADILESRPAKHSSADLVSA